MLKYKIYDLSVTIKNNMINWPNDPCVNIKKIYDKNKGDTVNLSLLKFGSHTGTHIDAPYHFQKKGKKIDEIDLKDLIGEVLVVEIVEEVITDKVLRNIELKKYKRIIFKTNNTKRKLLNKNKFKKDYVYIDKSGAKYLVKNKVKVIGIDYLSIERYEDKKGTAHKILTKNNIIILESLLLTKVSSGSYLLIALPLKIKNGDSAPARVVLIKFK